MIVMGKREKTVFTDRTKKHFGFLELEYGFRINQANNSDLRIETYGIVEYTSSTTVITIDSEAGSASVWFYRTKDGRKFDLDSVAIDEYLNTNEKEKELLLSTNPTDSLAASNLFNRKFLLNQPGWKSEGDTTEDKLQKRLANYANWLRIHANLCLEGNFLPWPKLYEYKVLRARADHLRRGKDELGYARIKDAHGNYKLVKQSIFRDKLEYVEKLKKEFSR